MRCLFVVLVGSYLFYQFSVWTLIGGLYAFAFFVWGVIGLFYQYKSRRMTFVRRVHALVE